MQVQQNVCQDMYKQKWLLVFFPFLICFILLPCKNIKHYLNNDYMFNLWISMKNANNSFSSKIHPSFQFDAFAWSIEKLLLNWEIQKIF